MSRSNAPGKINAGDVATLIYKFQLNHCATTEVMVRSGRVGSALFVAADTWLRKNLLENATFTHLSEATVGSTRSGTLGYLQDGRELIVEWSDFRVPGDSASGRLILRGCMSLPSDIEVWGTTLYQRGSMAKALYSESKTGSPLEVLIKSSGVFRDDSPWWPSGGGEHVATLRRGADGRWAVADIRDGPE
jgi:hypothetical protein